MTHGRRLGLLLALCTAMVSGVAVFLNSYGVKAFGNPTLYTTAKNIVAAVVLVIVGSVAARRDARPVRPRGARQWLTLAVIGVIGGSVPFVLFFEGLARASSVQAAFIQKTLVMWVALGAVLVLKERLHWPHLVAIVLLVVGQIGLAGGPGGIWDNGTAMILAATLLWSVEVVVAKRLLGDLSSWTVGIARMGFGSVVLVAWTMTRGTSGGLLHLTPTQWGWVLLTGLILAAYVGTWFAALARAQAVDVTAVLVIGALVTAALSAVVKGTALAPQTPWLVMLLTGTALVGWVMVRTPAVASARSTEAP